MQKATGNKQLAGEGKRLQRIENGQNTNNKILLFRGRGNKELRYGIQLQGY
jgi:hypothetical protein